MGGWNFIKNKTPAQLLPCEFYKIFEIIFFIKQFRATAFTLYLKHQIFEFSFLFSNFHNVYLLILVNFANVFILFIKWLRSLKYILTFTQFAGIFVNRSSRHLALFLGSMGCRKRKKKLENFNECYILGLGKTLFNYILLKFISISS